MLQSLLADTVHSHYFLVDQKEFDTTQRFSRAYILGSLATAAMPWHLSKKMFQIVEQGPVWIFDPVIHGQWHQGANNGRIEKHSSTSGWYTWGIPRPFPIT
jgi:hypothetical protein